MDFETGDMVRVTRTGLHGFPVGTMVRVEHGPNAVDIYRVKGPDGIRHMHRSDLHKPTEEANESSSGSN